MKALKGSFLLVLALIVSYTLVAQTKNLNYNNFEKEVMDYYPPKGDGATDQDYEKGKYFLENTYAAIRNDQMKFTYSDFWNIAVAFNKIGLPKSDIELAFQKTIDLGESAICEYIQVMYGEKPVQKHPFYKSIPELYASFCSECESLVSESKPDMSPAQYAERYQLDHDLILALAKINEKDQRHRGKQFKQLSKAQKKLDQENWTAAIEILDQYGYPGKTLAGDQYSAVIWSVIQHSNLALMEKYLPVIAQAVRENELAPAPLQMLLDRIYWLKHKTQIFGSQEGIPFASREEIKRVKKLYGF